MATPPELTTLDISGKYSMVSSSHVKIYSTRLISLLQNKTLTDMTKMDDVLRLQGVGWLTRKAIGLATIYLTIKHYKDSDGVEHIDVDQTATGGVHPTREERTLTWTEREHDDDLFGPVIGKSRRVKADDLDIPFLKEGWTSDTYDHGIIESFAKSDTPKSHTTWVAKQVCP
jgi:hypothetical protein